MLKSEDLFGLYVVERPFNLVCIDTSYFGFSRSDFMESEMENGFFAGSTDEGQDMYPRASH